MTNARLFPVRLSRFVMYGRYGIPVSTAIAIDRRGGGCRGKRVELVDGGPFTSWRDYRFYRADLTVKLDGFMRQRPHPVIVFCLVT